MLTNIAINNLLDRLKEKYSQIRMVRNRKTWASSVDEYDDYWAFYFDRIAPWDKTKWTNSCAIICKNQEIFLEFLASSGDEPIYMLTSEDIENTYLIRKY